MIDVPLNTTERHWTQPSVYCSVHYSNVTTVQKGMKIMEGETKCFNFLTIISVSTLTKCFFMDLKYGAEYSGHAGLTFKEAMESEKQLWNS